MKKAQNHVHKFRRHRYSSGNIVYFCALDCSFKISPALALGKRSICWRCGNEFVMDEYSIRLAKPHCQACHKPKNSNEVRISADVEVYGNRELVAEQAVARDTASDLRSRLTNVLHSKQTEVDEDI